MSLAHGILGFLNYGEMSGYDLAKAFDSSVKFFWHAQNSQIYKTLATLEKDGFVTHRTITQLDRPNKKLYSITLKGKEELNAWLKATDFGFEANKNPFLMKLFFSSGLDVEEVITRLNNFKSEFETFLTVLGGGVAGSITEYSQNISDCSPMYWQMTADFGAMYAKMCIDWAESCINKLQEVTK